MFFSPDVLDIPTMLFFFLQVLMSFLRANNSQMSCRKQHVEETNIFNFTMCHMQYMHSRMYVCMYLLFMVLCSLTCTAVMKAVTTTK